MDKFARFSEYILEKLCRVAEYLKLQRFIWTLVLLFAALGLIVSLLAFASRILSQQAIPIVSQALMQFQAMLPISAEIENVIRTLSLAFLPVAFTFAFVVCKQRQAVIDSLFEGYTKNYLDQVMERTKLNFVIVRASYGLYKRPQVYVGELTKFVEKELSVSLVEEILPGLQRTGHRAYRDGEALDVVFDFSRNLAPLGRIVDSEIGSPLGGTVCRADYKFKFISEKVYEKLIKEWKPEADFNNRVRIVSHLKLKEVTDLFQQ